MADKTPDDPAWRKELEVMQQLCEALEPLPRATAARVMAAVCFLYGHDELGQRALRQAKQLEAEKPHPHG